MPLTNRLQVSRHEQTECDTTLDPASGTVLKHASRTEHLTGHLHEAIDEM